MSNSSKPSGGSPIVGIVIGAVLMVGGMFVDKNFHPEFLEKLAQQGIPIEPGKVLAAIGVLLVLFPLVNLFFVKPLQEAIENRTNELDNTFSEVENLRNEMTQLKSDYEKRIAATEAEAREKIQAQVKEAQTLRQTLMAEASSKADELVKQAQVEIERERNKVLTDLRVHVVNLTLGATEKVIGANMDTATNRKLIEEFIEKAEVTA
ncbi:MAG: F0F1 ATP synthase subunit B [Armatimonadetes bacterium]|nr:F0F1 ATP synthase subunit B [Armatimonadota bacterium]